MLRMRSLKGMSKKVKLNILFLSLLDFDSLEESNIYTDLLNEFINNGHTVSVISPIEKRKNGKEELIQISDNCSILKLKIGNIQKTNIIEKGISTITVEKKFLKGIKQYLSNVKFDLILYSTPPITFQKVVSFVKKRDGAKSYLLLKDIFPQNAVDLEKFSKKGLIYRYFREKEKKLYMSSDFIGTMSKGNTEYLLRHNHFIDKDIVEINPNSIKINPTKDVGEDDKEKIRNKFGLSEDKLLLLYGGNLGAPQGIDFLLQIIDRLESDSEIALLIVGSGTEYNKIERYISDRHIKNSQLVPYLPKNEYSQIEKSADLGLIFLDSRFTIPNIPSRMLGYLTAGLPVLAATDSNTDLKDIITDNNFGKWSLHGSIEDFFENIHSMKDAELRKKMSKNGKNYLRKNCDVENSYKLIMTHFS